MKNRPPLAPSRPVPRPPIPPLPPPWQQPDVPPVTLAWELYSDKGILPFEADRVAVGAQFAGHVAAILALGAHDLLVGAHTGGVWHLAPNPAEPGMSQAWALSNDWDNPDVSCLCAGPDGPGHTYVGCRSIPHSDVVLYEASATSPGAWQVVLRGAAYGGVNAIGLASGRRVVVATDTGVWWSAIPGPIRGATLRTPVYSWQSARWPGRVGGSVPCTGLVMVNGAPVVSAAWGGAIWYGVWDAGGALVMEQGFAGLADTARSSLAVCATDSNQLWGVISRASGKQHIAAVVRSTNAGRSWQVINGMVGAGSSAMTLSDAAAEQGDYNNCIAVSPVAPRTVLIGWQAGVFVSTDGGNNYVGWGIGGHLHSDVHAIYFDPRDPTGKTVFVGSDGGVAQTSDLGTTFTTSWNQYLANLQFSGTPPRNNYGSMTPDLAVACRLGTGLQDNGSVWADARGPWHEIDNGDGAAVVFVTGGALVSGNASSYGAKLFVPSSDGFQGGATISMTRADGTVVANGLPDPVTAAVSRPGPPGSGFYAVGALDLPPDPNTNIKPPDEIYGLSYTKPDGSDASWQHVSTLPPGVVVWSLAAADSGTVYAGTWPAHVYKIDPASGQPNDLTGIPTLTPGQPDPNATITRIVVLDGGALLVVYNDSAYAGGARAGQLLHYSPDGTWTPLNGVRLDGTPTGFPIEPIFGLDIDPWGVLYATTDDRVYVAGGIGHNWYDMSGGLPKRAHLGEVRFARYPDGGIALYLATWGRSAWEARSQAATGPVVPGRGPGPGLAYNQIVGSLADGRLYQVGPGGLQPVGPIDPELQSQLIDSAQAMTARANELAILLTQTERDAGKTVSSDRAVSQIRALHNLLQRGLATMATVSAGPQQWAPAVLSSLITSATGMVTDATTALARQSAGALPDAIYRSITEITNAVTAHAKLVTTLSKLPASPPEQRPVS